MNISSRSGTKHIYTLKEGEKFALYGDHIIVIHPDRPPKIIDAKGNEIVLTFIPK